MAIATSSRHHSLFACRNVLHMGILEGLGVSLGGSGASAGRLISCSIYADPATRNVGLWWICVLDMCWIGLGKMC